MVKCMLLWLTYYIFLTIRDMFSFNNCVFPVFLRFTFAIYSSLQITLECYIWLAHKYMWLSLRIICHWILDVVTCVFNFGFRFISSHWNIIYILICIPILWKNHDLNNFILIWMNIVEYLCIIQWRKQHTKLSTL